MGKTDAEKIARFFVFVVVVVVVAKQKVWRACHTGAFENGITAPRSEGVILEKINTSQKTEKSSDFRFGEKRPITSKHKKRSWKGRTEIVSNYWHAFDSFDFFQRMRKNGRDDGTEGRS